MVHTRQGRRRKGRGISFWRVFQGESRKRHTSLFKTYGLLKRRRPGHHRLLLRWNPQRRRGRAAARQAMVPATRVLIATVR